MSIFFRISGLILIFLITSCSSISRIQGAGATFPEPLYSKMFSEYSKIKAVEVNYQPIGSGGGIRQLINKTVNFGATDVPMTEDELKEAKYEIIHIPTCIGAVALIYNLSVERLNLTPDIIADIFLGKIKKWNDKRLTTINPDVNFPDIEIVVVKRSDGSGTTYTFSDYLSTVSKEWQNTVGKGKSLNWPAGIGAKGNTGVAAYVKQSPGAIGYVEKSYASANNLKVAYIKNSAGNFVLPEIENIKEAARETDANLNIINSKSKNAYPISTFSWLIIYKDLSLSTKSIKEAKALVDLIWWMTHDGQKYNEVYDFAPLPENVKSKTEELTYSIVFKDNKILEKRN